MGVQVSVPGRIAEELRRRGMVLSAVVEALMKLLSLEPKAKARLELAERHLKEGKEYLAREDPVQASEKLYKVVEECIKALSEHYSLGILREVEKEGRWRTWLLGSASRELAGKLNEPRIADAWARAYDVHVWGQEAKYGMEEVEADLPHVEWLFEYTKQTNKQLTAELLDG